ncbi:BgTH12-06373 [Blumeria graminis f. sp. triticale]|uniref:COP9 signalosome complex subunit 3 n=3 Tax=Blumeria graminis TaxID=34373 RepID=A0A061HN60_BLUGR|nr:hypothetical protein BGT96224_1745 [Blumeria graminis f. sp. tritici 96224]CAD6500664.1 BgTH12-06373 [Blumeria graminis f. sp. triticale]VCU40942.1 Bgt-1745 [Blumeria graminis f. sp. tritici]
MLDSYQSANFKSDNITIDNILPKLLVSPPQSPSNSITDQHYDNTIRKQLEYVRSIPLPVFLQKTSSEKTALDVINPTLNTVPYTFVILANITYFSKRIEETELMYFWNKISSYLDLFDARQIRYLGEEFSSIIDAFINLSRQNDQSEHAIISIREALLRIDPSGAVLTPNHVKLTKLALESRKYHAIGQFLERVILYVPNSDNLPKPKYICSLSLSAVAYISADASLAMKLKYIDVLEYFLNCGIACLGCRKWESALKHFECAITFPTKDVVSKPMVEAYKKWILTGLISMGKRPNLPRSTSTTVSRIYHVLAKPYESLALIFENGTASRLKSEAEFGQRIWARDCNKGLVAQVLASYQKLQIRNLANIYSKISVSEVQNQTISAETGSKLSTVAEVESLVLNMIERGDLSATISSSPDGSSILSFSPTGPILSEAQMQQEIASTISRVQDISREISLTDRNLTYNPSFVRYLQRNKLGYKQRIGDTEGHVADYTMSWDVDVEDEDIMGVY